MSTKSSFFSRPVKVFGSIAVVILCVIFFLIPFAFRGARMGLSEMRNEVSDWLPREFEETKELDWFRHHFLGSQFVAISWEGCNEDDERFKALVAKLKQDSQATALDGEALRAKEIADTYGLHLTENTYETWGADGEKWLIGDEEQWYYVTREGALYRWTGGANMVGWILRGGERLATGSNEVKGELVTQFTGDFAKQVYQNPRLLNSRLFKQVLTGPDVFDQLAGPEGSLIRGDYDPRSLETLAAQIEAHRRLTGLFFGPTPEPGFDWTADSFLEALPQKTIDELPDAWREFFEEYVDQTLVEQQYEGDRQALLSAPQTEQLEHWYRLFYQLQVEPPPRQTCVVTALSDVASRDLSRVVGRPDFFKPTGRIYRLAAESGIPPAEAHLGGPPVDNVAIDEEGTITLFKLISLSTLIGVTLAYLSFRSINVTLMIFFIGGVSAVMSVGFVWFGGSSLDAILLSMPSLVYVLGLSGAVHIVNYYREACHANGPEGACETALRHGWFPCTIAAFTTALGLLSLYTSNLIPIKKFGLFSALGTMATVILLFTYLPSALTLWPPGYKREEHQKHDPTQLTIVHRFWDWVGAWIVQRYAVVCTVCLIVMVAAGFGISKIRTSVQLLKLFDNKAKVITDYEWLETHLGRLVPMEVVLTVDPEMMRDSKLTPEQQAQSRDLVRERRLTFLERLELSSRVRQVIEEEFGDQGRGIIGPGMSSDVMILAEPLPSYVEPIDPTRTAANGTLLEHRDELAEQLDFFRMENIPLLAEEEPSRNSESRELWRISLRLGAFNDVDYGRFVADLKQVVEPVLSAYRVRDELLTTLYEAEGGQSATKRDLEKSSILLLGWSPRSLPSDSVTADQTQQQGPTANTEIQGEIDQDGIFCSTLRTLMENRSFSFTSGRGRVAYSLDYDNPQHQQLLENEEVFRKQLSRFSAILLIKPPSPAVQKILEEEQVTIIDATNHLLEVDPVTKETLNPTAIELWKNPQTRTSDNYATAVYTGIVPIVYKAQRTLLSSLIDSICLAFAMIAVVMMLLLRDWQRRFSWRNSLNVSGGLASMLPNLFPVVLIFGLMGHMGIEVDIGSMMTASVALGVAVDDTIHFLSWFRLGMRNGLSRRDSIRSAYARVATAMTQTTLIGGLGLSAFAFSTFTPTQRFGVLMLTLLFAALLGDLIFLPALLASPLGRFFGVKPKEEDESSGRGGSGNNTGRSDLPSDDSASPAPTNSMPDNSQADKPPNQKSPGEEARTGSRGGPHVTNRERGSQRLRTDASHGGSETSDRDAKS